MPAGPRIAHGGGQLQGGESRGCLRRQVQELGGGQQRRRALPCVPIGVRRRGGDTAAERVQARVPRRVRRHVALLPLELPRLPRRRAGEEVETGFGRRRS